MKELRDKSIFLLQNNLSCKRLDYDLRRDQALRAGGVQLVH
jgi:hypothetical protein